MPVGLGTFKIDSHFFRVNIYQDLCLTVRIYGLWDTVVVTRPSLHCPFRSLSIAKEHEYTPHRNGGKNSTIPDLSSGNVTFFQQLFRDSSAFYYVLISSIRQSKTSAEARRAPSVTEAATSLRTWSRKQLTFQSWPPAGRHLKISRIRDCAGSHHGCHPGGGKRGHHPRKKTL